MRKNAILVLLVLIIFVRLFGQFGYILNRFESEIIDARAEALGRTSILSSSEANYIFNNPAMLSNLVQRDIQFNMRAISGKSERKSDYEDFDTKYNHPFHFKLVGFSFGIPAKMLESENKNMKLGLGVGYRTYYDWSNNTHYESDHENSDYEYDKKYHGGFNTIVLGSGFNYQNNLLGGISISFPFLSNISYKYENSEDYKSETEGSLKGSFFTLSGAYVLNEDITLGTRLRTGFTLKWEEEKDNGDKYESDIYIPLEFGFAIELKVYSNFKIYAEYLTRGFGNYKVESNNSDLKLYNDSNNGYSFRTGFETGISNVFRSGFFMQSIPVYELKYMSYDDVYDAKPQTDMGFTAGFGLKINPNESLDIFGAYSFLSYDESFEEEYSRNQYSTKYFYSRIKIGCSMGYSF